MEEVSKCAHHLHMEPYDRAKALQCFGDEEIFVAAVSTFLEEIDSMLEQVEVAVEARSLSEIKEKAHWVKGGLVYLHARPSAEAASRLEEAAENEDEDALSEQLNVLKVEVNRLKASLSSTSV